MYYNKTKTGMKKIPLLLTIILIISIFSGCITLKTDHSPDSKTSDSDNDGIPNYLDDFPFDPFEQHDSDNDGVGNNGDKFPRDPAASVDSDNDGFPDRWNTGKNQSDSSSKPPLELDEFPDDPDEWIDTDGDGVGDNGDVFPDDSDEWSDIDKDGIGDNSDINPLVNLSLDLTIKKFKVTGVVDFLRRAQVYFLIKINGEVIKTVKNNGKNWNVKLNKEKNVNYNIYFDIPDDNEDRYLDIEIVMIDYDYFGSDDIIDISSVSKENTLLLTVDKVKNSISKVEDITEGSQGILWYNISLSDEVEPPSETYTRFYRWRFNDKIFEFSIEIPVEKYEEYKYADVERIPQRKGPSAMRKFVTSDDEIIQNIANQLKEFAEDEKYNDSATGNFILRFVQTIIRYNLDNKTHGCTEYWSFPVETLVDKQGDCEDTSVLFASIMDALKYETILLFYILDEDYGHLAVGIHLYETLGEFVTYGGNKYYYCETTTQGYNIGRLPPDIEGEPDKIISI
jgi:hypothetical protein